MKYLIKYLPLLILTPACGDPVPPVQASPSKEQTITVKICDCMMPLIAINQAAQALAKSDDPASSAAFLAKLQEAESVHNEAKACLVRLQPEIKQMTPAQKQALAGQLQAQCPESAGQGELLEVVLE